MIVCGLHGVGLRTVEQLHHADVPVSVVVDHDEVSQTVALQSWGVPVVLGSAKRAGTLRAAGLTGAAAVVCVLSDDLQTLETALLARELRPEVRVVVQLRNPAVGRALTDVDITVLDVAALSAPSIVEACLGTGSHEVQLEGVHFISATTRAGGTDTLRRLFGELAPVAIRSGPTGEVVLCPGRDAVVHEGDLVTVMGTPQQLAFAGVPTPRAPRPAVTRRRHLAASLLGLLDRRLMAALGCIVALVVVSTIVLHSGYLEPDGTRMTVLDAVYFTVETIVTVGYGDFNFREQPSELRLFAIILMMLGAVMVTVFFALMTNIFVSRGIAEALGRRLVTAMSGHMVVVGLGSVGVQVVERLRAAGADVVVVDLNDDNRYLSQVRACGARVVIGDGTLPQTLRSVSLEKCAGVALLTSDDLVNLESGLAVRDQLRDRWQRTPVVLRLFDRQLSDTVERNFGFRYLRSTAELAAPWFVGAALGLDVLGTFYVADHPMLVARLTVPEGGGLDGLALGDLSVRTRVVAISRTSTGGALEHQPRRGTQLRAGDRIYLIGSYEELLRLLRTDAGSAAAVVPPGAT